MSDQFPALAGLAFSAFTSATVLPGTSEAVVLALQLSGAAPAPSIFAVASSANVAGSCVNWSIGYYASRLRGTRWLPESGTLLRAENWFRRWGKWCLLLSWIPIVGDPMTLVAGLARLPFLVFLGLVSIAKMGRYAAVMLLAGQF